MDNHAHPNRADGRPEAAAPAVAPAPAALPCLNSNNSNGDPQKRYPLQRIAGTSFWRSKSHERAVWQEVDEDTIERIGFPNGAEAKAAFHLRRNVEAFVRHWGRSRCLFFTLTDEAGLHPRDFARRWNSFLVRNGGWIRSFIRVLEPQKQGRPHYHLLVAAPWDTGADRFDWEAFDACQVERRTQGPTGRFRELRARYKASAAPELVALWAQLRKVLPRYGLGRAEVLPLRKSQEAIAEYVGKYLEAGLVLRKHAWKGCRRVEFDRRAKGAWLACSRVFAWRSPGAALWRKRVGEVAAALGVHDMDGIRRILGPRWAYQLRDAITGASKEDWQTVLMALGVLRGSPSISF